MLKDTRQRHRGGSNPHSIGLESITLPLSHCATEVKMKIFERKIVNIFLPISLNMCFGCSKEPSHRDGSFEYPQHMFWLRNKKIDF